MSDFYSLKAKAANGETFDFAQLKGQTVLVVNVASKCGFTPQYDGLEDLYKKYGNRGFTILGFPSNEFGAQEPGNDGEIQNFCKLEYGVTFPVLAKTKVNGGDADPVYKWLKSEAPGILGTEAIKWNFTKFLVDKNGKVVDRYAPQTKPEELSSKIEAIL